MATVPFFSEETGAISLAYDSKLHYDLTEEQIISILKKELNIYGAIIGKAYYIKAIDLSQAIKVAK